MVLTDARTRRESSTIRPVSWDGSQLLDLLRIAHKYCMDTIEKSTIDVLKKTVTIAGYVDLVVASRIVDSKELFDEAVKGLVRKKRKPTLKEARIIGTDVVYAILEAVVETRDSEPRCGHCGK